jgi:hypothetical protein
VKILNLLFYFVSIIPFIALPFLLVNWVRYMKARAENRSRFVPLPVKFPVKSTLFFAGPIIIAIAIAEIMATRSRVEAINFLRDLSGNYKVYVNSQPAHDPDKVVSALKASSSQLAHHSHPTKMIRVDIYSDTGRLTLDLGRDSGSAQEYWVFYPKYRVTSNNEIGRVTTPVFDEY